MTAPAHAHAPGPDPAAAALALRGVHVRYGEVRALEGVDLEVAPGRVTALIGMNGSGKSTLFRTAMGLQRPDAGTVRIGGLPPERARARGAAAYVPQSEAVAWDFPISVREVVMTGRYGHQGPLRRPSRADRVAVEEALDRVELADLAERQIGRLSGGQRKRAFVARGIAQDAGLLLLDEPFAGVDTRSEATIVRLLRELAADGRAVLVSTHDLHSLPQLADEAVLLLRRVLYHGPVAGALEPATLARAFGLETGEPMGAPSRARTEASTCARTEAPAAQHDPREAIA